MSQYTINNSNDFSNITNSFGVQNSCTFTDERSQLLILLLMEVVYDRAQVLMGRKFVVVVFAMVVAS